MMSVVGFSCMFGVPARMPEGCIVLVHMQVNCYASIFTMTAMSVDRYLAVVHPLRSRRYRTPRHAVVACVATWLSCAVIMLPIWLYADVDAAGDGCQVRWPPGSTLAHQFFWNVFEFVVGFAGPIVVMSVGYWRLLRGLFYSTRTLAADPSVEDRSLSPAAADSASPQRSSVRSGTERTRRQLKRVTATVLAVTAAFIVCWTPHHVVRFMSLHKLWMYAERGVRPTRRDVVVFRVLNTVAQALIFASSCCNPFIYCISSSNFSEPALLLPSSSLVCPRRRS